MGYKIIIPKAGQANADGTERRTYLADEQVEANEEWQKSVMEGFVANGWAVETKTESTSDVEKAEPVKKTRKKRAKKKASK